jgi:hypothetical protein
MNKKAYRMQQNHFLIRKIVVALAEVSIYTDDSGVMENVIKGLNKMSALELDALHTVLVLGKKG